MSRWTPGQKRAVVVLCTLALAIAVQNHRTCEIAGLCRIWPNAKFAPGGVLAIYQAANAEACCELCRKQLLCDVFTHSAAEGSCTLQATLKNDEAEFPQPIAAAAHTAGFLHQECDSTHVRVVSYKLLHETARLVSQATDLAALLLPDSRRNQIKALLENSHAFELLQSINSSTAAAVLVHSDALEHLMGGVERLNKQGILARDSDLHIRAVLYFILHLTLRPLCASTKEKDDFSGEREWGMYLMNTKSPCYQMSAYYFKAQSSLQIWLLRRKGLLPHVGPLIETLLGNGERQQPWQTSSLGQSDAMASPRMLLEVLAKHGEQLNLYTVNIGAGDIPIARDDGAVQEDAVSQLYDQGWAGLAIEPDQGSFRQLLARHPQPELRKLNIFVTPVNIAQVLSRLLQALPADHATLLADRRISYVQQCASVCPFYAAHTTGARQCILPTGPGCAQSGHRLDRLCAPRNCLSSGLSAQSDHHGGQRRSAASDPREYPHLQHHLLLIHPVMDSPTRN
jgi:hypothetical protein